MSRRMYQKHWVWNSPNARRASRIRTMFRAWAGDSVRRLRAPPFLPIREKYALTDGGAPITASYHKPLTFSSSSSTMTWMLLPSPAPCGSR